jgi:hypothetical protein
LGGVAVHSGVSVLRTGSTSISSTGRSRIGAQCSVNDCRHCHWCLAERQLEALAARYSSATWPKVGMARLAVSAALPARRSASGSIRPFLTLAYSTE